MIFQFKDEEELGLIKKFVRLVADVYDNSGVCTIDALARRLDTCNGKIDLDETKNLDDDMKICFRNMLRILDSIGADEVAAANEILQRCKHDFVEYEADNFIKMLNDKDIDPRICEQLFIDYVSKEGAGQISIDCFNIQEQHHVDMTSVWNWCLNYVPKNSATSNWRDERVHYREKAGLI